MKRCRAAVAAACALACCVAAAQERDVLIQAMKDELARTADLALVAPDKPYLVSYSVEDATAFTVEATLGALVGSNDQHFRVLLTRLRVGDYDFDNTNYVASDYYPGVHYDSGQLPLENNYGVLRNALWLSTDRAYKTAIDAIARKRAALASVNVTEKMPDYFREPAVTLIEPTAQGTTDEGAWKERTRRLSATFLGYPDVLASDAEAEIIHSTEYLVSTEGSVVRRPDSVSYVRVRGWGEAPDGMRVRDSETLVALDPSSFPPAGDMEKSARNVAEQIAALTHAPAGSEFTGPVLFEPKAAAQLFAQLLGENLKLARKPVPNPGQTLPWIGSELEGRIGSRILPEWMTVVDDATQTEWRGVTLLGHYDIDDEGVRPQPTVLVDKGVLKGFLLTRTPPRPDINGGSNGHARFPGPFGEEMPGLSNLFVHASKTSSLDDLKKQLIDLCRQRGKPYGIMVRELDFPSAASVSELRQMTAENMRSGGGGRPPVPPILVYRVYPDGREELVRGLRFR